MKILNARWFADNSIVQVVVLPGVLCTAFFSGVPLLRCWLTVQRCGCFNSKPVVAIATATRVRSLTDRGHAPRRRKHFAAKSSLRGNNYAESESDSQKNGNSEVPVPFSPGAWPKPRRSLRRLSGILRKRKPNAALGASASGRRLAGVAGLSGLIGFGLGRIPQSDDTDGYDFEEIVGQLQGQWEDEIGITIHISGTLAVFSDDPEGSYFIEEGDGMVRLREANLIALGDAPVWRFPWGRQHQWQRLTTPEAGDAEWDEVFRQYKSDRLELWKKLCLEHTTRRRAHVEELETQWKEGGPLPVSLSGLFFRSRLLAGKDLVPGVCFIHRRFGYRGVVIGHESKCLAMPRWKVTMGVDTIPGGEKQPFYHCIVDDRDRPRGQMTYVAEVNLLPDFSGRAFPLESDLAKLLLIGCEEVCGYRPGRELLQMLRRLRADGGRFVL
mmetsp:Transcript_29461/g.57714  ORF Transcript_29461/g.57714 Transcript_29461/m.57714 type:complete len:440 (+) Transcript_29461:42-1361(+)